MRQIIFITVLIMALCWTVCAQTVINSCPEIKFLNSKTVLPDESTILTVEVDENSDKDNLRFEWTFSVGEESAGKILKGQGTPQVEFFISEEYSGGNLTINVKVLGLSPSCPNVLSDSLWIENIIEESSEPFGKVTLNEYREKLDRLFSSLENNPRAEGLISISFDKSNNRKYKISLLKNIKKHITFRKFDPARITFAVTEKGSTEENIFWLIPSGANFPRYIRKRNYQIIRAEDLETEIKELFVSKRN